MRWKGIDESKYVINTRSRFQKVGVLGYEWYESCFEILFQTSYLNDYWRKQLAVQ